MPTHDVDCVVHAINNALGFPLLAKHQVERDLSYDFDPDVGFTPSVVVRYVHQHFGVEFTRVAFARPIGRYILEIEKPTYTHMVAYVDGHFKDNELKIHQKISGEDKILAIYKLVE
jgi:hypothetical protein